MTNGCTIVTVVYDEDSPGSATFNLQNLDSGYDTIAMTLTMNTSGT